MTTDPVRAEPTPGPALEERLDAFVQDLRRRGRLAEDERTAWSVTDLDSGDKLVAINEDEPLQAASMIKPLVALAFFHQVAEGTVGYGPTSRQILERMIQVSDNRATNRVLRRLGGPRTVEGLLRRHYGGLLREIRIVEYIPPGGRTYRNRASAHDYSRFLHALWHDRLPGAEEIKRLMALPNRDRLYTDAVATSTEVYDKTGSTRSLCGNIGIVAVDGPGGTRRAYTVVGIIEKGRPASRYRAWIRSRGNVIREVSKIVHRTMLERYGRQIQLAGASGSSRPGSSRPERDDG